MPTDRPGNAGGAPNPNKGERRNTLRLSPRELTFLLDGYDLPDADKSHANREFIRWPFRCDAVQVMVSPPGGGASKITMACRNISRSGISLLHSCFMHAGTRCTVLLPRPQRPEAPVQGCVVHCGHRSGMIHEIGITFTAPIDVREFIRPDPFADCFSLERIDPEQLNGCVLYVDGSDLDTRIVRHFLRGTLLSVRTASSIAQTLTALETSPDLIIANLDLVDGSGMDLMAAVRQCGSRVPVIIATSDTGDAVRKAIAANPPDACLAKPLTSSLLHRAIAEFLIVKRKEPRKKPAVAGDQETAALARVFAGGLQHTVAQLEAAIKSGNTIQARSICLQIAGSAPTVGFAELGEMAQETARALARAKGVPEVCIDRGHP